MFDITFGKPFDGEKDWPRGEDGEMIRPALLAHLSDTQIEADIIVNMLRAYNIPVFRAYPNDGDFGKIIMGFAGTGVDICVPETMLEDAQNLLSADVQPETESENE